MLVGSPLCEAPPHSFQAHLSSPGALDTHMQVDSHTHLHSNGWQCRVVTNGAQFDLGDPQGIGDVEVSVVVHCSMETDLLFYRRILE